MNSYDDVSSDHIGIEYEAHPAMIDPETSSTRYNHFDRESLVTVGRFRSAPWIVTVDDVPYAGFVDRESAVSAAKLWTGYVDGLGRIVDDRRGCHWPGCEGRIVRVVRNGSWR